MSVVMWVEHQSSSLTCKVLLTPARGIPCFQHQLHRLAPSFQPIPELLVSLCSSLHRLLEVRLQGPLGGMRCSAGLQRLARLALSGPHTHGWAAPLAEAASAAGAQGALTPGAACAAAGRRYLWQDGRLAHGAPCCGAALVPKARLAVGQVVYRYKPAGMALC